jgi:hypothetical protein
MFPRRECPRCQRSISVKRDGTIRGHFCPHYKSCEQGRCHDCETADVVCHDVQVALAAVSLPGEDTRCS